jgi:hypothetical protein
LSLKCSTADRRRKRPLSLAARLVPAWLRAQTDGHRSRAAAVRARDQLRRSVDRWAERSSARAAQRSEVNLIGLDVARAPGRLRGTSWLPMVAAVVLGALLLAGLRVDVIRLRLALAGSFEEELRLEREQRELTVQMRRLRDPAELARRAEALGFRRAERLIDLGPGPAPAEPDAHATTLKLAAANARQLEVRR